MKRIYSFDFIKFFAVLGVLVIHNSLFYNLQIGGVNLSFLGFIVETLSRFAVPYFFVTAGFVYFKNCQRKGVLKNFIPYIKKIALLYLIWTIIYFVNNCYTSIIWDNYTITDYFYENIFLSDLLYYGKYISEPLWFLPALLYSIGIVTLGIRFNKLKILLPLSLILNIAGLFAKPQMLGFIGNLPFFTRDALFFGLFYTSLGAFLAEGNRFERVKGSNKLWFVVFLLSTLLVMVEKMTLGNMNMWLDIGDYFLFTIPQILSLLILSLRKPELGKNSILTYLGKGALGIYLIHSFIQTWLQSGYYTIIGPGFWNSPWRHFTVLPILFIISWLFYYTLPSLAKKGVRQIVSSSTK